jgi:Tol biopolymer transport system component
MAKVKEVAMRQWKSYSIVITFLFLLLFAIVASCAQPPVTTKKAPPSQRPAEFEVGPVKFEPPVVMVGDSVNVTATIKNISDIAGNYTAALTIDGQVVDSRDISILLGQSCIAEFTIDNLTAGKHAIAIGESGISIDVLPKPARIALSRYYGDYYSWDICTMDPDGTNIKNITNSAAVDLHPTWSPDGTKIAFQSIREAHNLSSIYVMDADGKNVKCLTPEVKICRFPAWSPDGTKIAYCVMKRGGAGSWKGGVMTMGAAAILPDAIFIMNPDGGGKTRVADGWGPSWFPDSQRIAFGSNYSGVWEIYSSNIYGSEVIKHGAFPKAKSNYGSSLPSCEFPMLAVSPDGSSIALEYLDNTPGGKQDIYILTLDTGEVRNLTSKYDGYKYCPTWSPDGTKIAFTLETTNDTSICVINADGSNFTKLMENGLWATWQR